MCSIYVNVEHLRIVLQIMQNLYMEHPWLHLLFDSWPRRTADVLQLYVPTRKLHLLKSGKFLGLLHFRGRYGALWVWNMEVQNGGGVFSPPNAWSLAWIQGSGCTFLCEIIELLTTMATIHYTKVTNGHRSAILRRNIYAQWRSQSHTTVITKKEKQNRN